MQFQYNTTIPETSISRSQSDDHRALDYLSVIPVSEKPVSRNNWQKSNSYTAPSQSLFSYYKNCKLRLTSAKTMAASIYCGIGYDALEIIQEQTIHRQFKHREHLTLVSPNRSVQTANRHSNLRQQNPYSGLSKYKRAFNENAFGYGCLPPVKDFTQREQSLVYEWSQYLSSFPLEDVLVLTVTCPTHSLDQKKTLTRYSQFISRRLLELVTKQIKSLADLIFYVCGFQKLAQAGTLHWHLTCHLPKSHQHLLDTTTLQGIAFTVFTNISILMYFEK